MSHLASRVLLFFALTFAVIVPAFSQDVLDGLLDLNDSASAPAASIKADAGRADDLAIERRLDGIFSEFDTLQQVRVDVSNGVVTLTGSVSSSTAAERADALAGSVDGVVDVIEAVTVNTDVMRRLEDTVKRLSDTLLSVVAASPLVLIAMATLAFFWWVSGWLTKGRRVFDRLAPNSFLADLFANVVRIFILLLGIIVALSLLDATSIIGTVLGAAGIAGLAIGFAVRDTVENYIASILLSLRTPFLARDFVEIGAHAGHVARLTGRATILISVDGNHIRIPNATVFKSTIINYSRNPERRFTFEVGVDTDLDPGHARKVALDALQKTDSVLRSPSPGVVVSELGDSNVTLSVHGWIDQRKTDLAKARSEAIRGVKQSFDAAGIVMPEPIYRLRVDTRGGALPVAGGPSQPAEQTDKPASSTHDQTPRYRKSSQAVAGSAGTTESRPERSEDKPTVDIGESDTSAELPVQATLAREATQEGGENLLSDENKQE